MDTTNAPVVPPATPSAPSNSHIKIYFIAIEFIGIIVPIIISTLIYKIPSWFLWMPHREVACISLFIIGITHATLFSLHEYTKKNAYYNAAQYAYAAFFIYFIFITGGIDSSFIFLLVFPLLTSAVYLDRATTRDVGIFITIALAALIFVYPEAEITSSLITHHTIQTALVGMIAYFMHHIVIESLRQKTEKEEASKRLIELAQVDALKNDFLSIAEHQLRTPLTGIKWALESIGDNPAAPDAGTILKTSIERVNDAIRIVGDMLKATESTEKALTVKKASFDMGALIWEIATELELLAQRKEVTVYMHVPKSLPISGDKKLLKAAINNIIDNSYKYSPQAQVDITLADETSQIKLTVHDTGIGISPVDMKYVFERMYRGKNALKIEPDQNGIGLYTARKIINLHGGTISITSELNKGTTVTVVLPKE
jgi:signal transduction histidine kinase